MPSLIIYDLAYAINFYFKGSSVKELLNDMSIEEFMDLAVYCINRLEEQKDEIVADNHVNNNTKPLPIKQGGWF